jgi:hypothetical protein
MRSARFSSLSPVVLTVALIATGCGGSSSVTGPDEAPGALGASVVQGTVLGGGFAAPSGDVTALSRDGGLTVTVEGTSLSTRVDEEGQFILTRVPSGTVTLIFEGPGISARLMVSGLVDGQVLSLECLVNGSSVEVTSPAHTTPSKRTKITGHLESKSGTRLVVDGHQVEASQVSKVWRGDRRTELEHIRVGEKIKVWGTLGGDGVLVAEEIQARSNGDKEWVVLDGRVTAVVGAGADIHANPNTGSGSCGTASIGDVHANPNTSSCPTFYVDNVRVITDNQTRFVKADGRPLDPGSIRAGQHAYVEGWQEPGKAVLATTVKIG